MKRNITEVKADLLTLLEENCDEKLMLLGFKRRKGSLSYVRKFDDVSQSIIFTADYFPQYQKGAEIHIHPKMILSMESVTKATLDLVADDATLLANAPHMIMNQPIEFASLQENPTRWFAYNNSEMSQRISDICVFINKWIIVFFDELKTPYDLVNIYKTNDSRMMKQKHWYLFVAGAEVVCGNLDKSLMVLDKNLGSTGLRKRYAAAFDYHSKKRAPINKNPSL